jgi:hypothetical protein
MYPNEQSYMPKESVSIKKHIQTYMLNACVITENAKLYKIIIKPVNTFKIILLVIHLVMPATYMVMPATYMIDYVI